MMLISRVLPILIISVFLTTSGNASLKDVLSSALLNVRNALYTPDDDEDSKVTIILDEGKKILQKLTVELDRLGKNAYQSAVSDKDEGVQETFSACAAKKGALANGIFKIKRQQLRDCYNTTGSLINDLAESILDSNQPNSANMGNLLRQCKDEEECREIDATSLQGKYETWGSRLSAVHRCVENTIKQATSEYILIFKSLRQECLSNDYIVRKRSALLPAHLSATKQVKIPRPRTKKEKLSRSQSKNSTT